jgi:hypothetical protein
MRQILEYPTSKFSDHLWTELRISATVHKHSAIYLDTTVNQHVATDRPAVRNQLPSMMSRSSGMNHAETVFHSPGLGDALLPQLVEQMRMQGAIDALDQESARGDLFETEVSSIKQRSRLVGSIQLSD